MPPPAPTNAPDAQKAKRPGSRNAFVRTKVPVVERVISCIVVCLLAGIGVAVWIKGKNFDPNLYSLRNDALNSTASAVDGKSGTLRVDSAQAEEAATAKTRPAPNPSAAPAKTESKPEGESGETTSAEGEESSNKPWSPTVKSEPMEVKIPGIKPMAETEFYNSENLFQKIDGRAPAYQGFNVQQLRCRSFAIEGADGSFIDVYEYRMDTPMNAFGIFALERDPKGKPLDFIADGYSGELGYYFRQGPVYAQIIASDQKPKTMELARAIAENRAKALPVDDTGLDGRRRLPSVGLLADTVAFIQDNAYGQEFLKSVFQATYDFEGKKLTFFIMATTPEAAAAAWKSYLDFSGRYGGKATALPDADGAKVFRAESFGSCRVIYQREGEIGGVVDSDDPEKAARFVQQYLQGKLK